MLLLLTLPSVVGVGSVVLPSLPVSEVGPLVVGVTPVVVVAPLVAAQLVVLAAREARAYDPPETSVPRAESLQALVYSST